MPINEQIRASKVQVIDEQGEKRGVMSIHDALDLAYDKKLDLVLVAPNAEIPVCKIMNYGKYKFEQSKKEKEAKKKQKTFEIKEIRITPNIEQHDFEFKLKNAQKFIEDGNKVKITVRFRGREMNYVKLGEQVLNKFIERLADIIILMRKYKIEPKRVRFVHSKINKEPTLILIKGVKNANPFLKIEKPLIIYNENGKYTDEIYEIYNMKNIKE